MQLLAKFKKNFVHGVQNHRKFKVAFKVYLPMIGQFFDTMIAASIDKKW